MSNKKNNAGRKVVAKPTPKVNIHRSFTNEINVIDILYSIAVLKLKEKE